MFLPIDVIKIDQSFVRDMLEDSGDKTIVQGIIALAKAFDLKVVAEGIGAPRKTSPPMRK
jgi:EAL domain-containing protein (putative c-di-GMP-specific phosphodiesterase class I)